MNDITQNFGTLYHPKTALVFYQTDERNPNTYVEHFDMDKNGNPINAHPLTEREAKALAKSFQQYAGNVYNNINLLYENNTSFQKASKIDEFRKLCEQHTKSK